MPTNVRDPRSIITREAFEIDEALLGTPLARPGQRLVAILIDIAVIGLLNVFASGLGLLIWGVVALFLLRVAFMKPSRKMGQVTSVLFRGSTGCLGFLILLIVALMGMVTVLSRDEGMREEFQAAVGRMGAGFLEGIEPVQQLRTAGTEEEAEVAAQALLSAAAGLLELDPDAGEEEMVDLLVQFMGEDPAWTESPEDFAEEMVRRFRTGASEAPVEAPASLDSTRLAELAELPLPQAVTRYQEGLEAGRTAAADPAQAALRSRILGAVAADTLESLQDALGDEVRRRERSEESLVGVRAELEAQGSGFVALLRDIWDQAGSAVGLWSIYFTVTLTLFKGFTVGKRILGIRVVRLDGEPLTWWSSFERGGGYVAGIATGLLGFAQIYWDANRQCVHDKIGGTVVVIAGARGDASAAAAAWSERGSSED